MSQHFALPSNIALVCVLIQEISSGAIGGPDANFKRVPIDNLSRDRFDEVRLILLPGFTTLGVELPD